MSKKLLITALSLSLATMSASAAQETGAFAEFELLGGGAWGGSATTNAGGVPPTFSADGVIDNVKFSGGLGASARLGYQMDPNWSGFVEYQLHTGTVGWDTTFSGTGSKHTLKGNALSNIVLGGVGYTFHLNDNTKLRTNFGVGASINTLSDVVEQTSGGTFMSVVADGNKVNPAARAQIGLEHKVADNITLGASAGVTYVGEFTTGNTRFGSLGVTSINPHVLNNVWRADAGLSLKVAF